MVEADGHFLKFYSVILHINRIYESCSIDPVDTDNKGSSQLKKSVKYHTRLGGLDQFGSFSHFFLVLIHASLQRKYEHFRYFSVKA